MFEKCLNPESGPHFPIFRPNATEYSIRIKISVTEKFLGSVQIWLTYIK